MLQPTRHSFWKECHGYVRVAVVRHSSYAQDQCATHYAVLAMILRIYLDSFKRLSSSDELLIVCGAY